MNLKGHQEAVTCLQFDDCRIVSGSIDCTLRFWDIQSGTCQSTLDWKASEGHTGVIRQRVVSGKFSHYVYLNLQNCSLWHFQRSQCQIKAQILSIYTVKVLVFAVVGVSKLTAGGWSVDLMTEQLRFVISYRFNNAQKKKRKKILRP